MAQPSLQEVSLLLQAWRRGDQAALDRLMPIVYNELRRLAYRYMACERVNHTLRATALVNEAYVRLIDANQVQWRNRTHFFAVSAQLMRRVPVDCARARAYQKRGGRAGRVTLDEAFLMPHQPDPTLVELNDALNALLTGKTEPVARVDMPIGAGLSKSPGRHYLLFAATDRAGSDLMLIENFR